MTTPPAREREPVRRTLPLGVQSFRPMRQDGHYYVDKTLLIERLVRQGSRYFLSRPRRFGKSLLIDTLAELFRGSEELFRGLAIHDSWDWSVRRAVVRLDFASGVFSTPERLEQEVVAQLNDQVRQAGLGMAEGFGPDADGTAPPLLRRLIRSLHETTGHRVAVLVDEYDKPIVDNLESPDVARTNRDFLSGLYGTFKSCDAHIRFLLLTGVTKFSKVNLFSGLNNLTDITLDPRFATICGYTQDELDTVFEQELEAPDLKPLDRGKIKEWYDGYRWLGEPVYNPYDVLLLLRIRKFRAHWFNTGTPRFLLDFLERRGVTSFALEGIETDESLLSAFDVDHISTEALLWQTGYLTIAGVEDDEEGEEIFRLGYPNLEVRRSLNRHLFGRMTGRRDDPGTAFWRGILRALRTGDAAGVESELRALFAGIPHEWHTRSDIARYEGYYASVFYAFLQGTGLDVRAEESSAAGRADIAVVLDGAAWVFELKIEERASEGAALAQLRERGYADRHRRGGRKVHLVGIHFSEESRTVTAFEVAEG
ncbi:MAG: AAA family ATPase [Gemmatimonadota bacterium]|nr:AAA family ATPase [Gemmatimonadota bacterium]